MKLISTDVAFLVRIFHKFNIDRDVDTNIDFMIGCGYRFISPGLQW